MSLLAPRNVHPRTQRIKIPIFGLKVNHVSQVLPKSDKGAGL